MAAAYAGVAAQSGRVVRRGWLARKWPWLPGWVFAVVTQAPALLAIAWLVPGTAMLLVERLLPVPMLIMFIPLTIALCYFAMRRLPVGWPRFGEGHGVPVGAVLLMLTVAAGFGVWQAAFRSEPLFAASDPGVYLQYGYWIAEHGTAHVPTSSLLFGSSAGLDFATAGFTVSGDSLTPLAMPGLPLVLAGGTWLGGLGGALLMPAVLGGCALLSFGGLVGRLCGAWWAVAAELVLALCLPEIFVSRTPMSEPLVQVLLFGGLCLYIDSLVPSRVSGGRGLALAGLGGLAIGLTVLASVGSLAMLLPAFPVVGVLFVARRAQAAPFGVGLFVGIGIGLLAGLVLARPYLSSLSTQLHLIGYAVAGFGFLTALLAPLAFPGVRAWTRRMCTRRVSLKWFKGQEIVLPSVGSLLSGLALVLPVLMFAGLAARPYLQTVRGQTNPSMIRAVASLQRLERLPVDGRRQYYESSLYWVFWYLGLPAVLLACAGAAVLGRRLVRRALASDASVSLVAALRPWGLPFLLIAWSVVTVLWNPSTVPWQPLGSHRLVPLVLPGLLLLAVWMSSRLRSWATALGAARIIVALIGVCCVLALVIPPLVTTFNPGLANRASVGRESSRLAKQVSRVQLRGVGAAAAYGGSVAAASSLCRTIGSSASVLFVDSSTAALYAPTIRGLCGQPTALVVAPSLAALEQAVSSVEQIGRRPVVLGPTRASVAVLGVAPRQVLSLRTSSDASVLTGPPGGNWPVTYTLWVAIPTVSA
ncbi:MAG TPA: hypothetical protein VN714_07395 [Trebonia sp.]|nr:hypothetical protein [Trebonia sp.]